MALLATCVPRWPKLIVVPSSTARTARPTPIDPPAPVTFSITMDCPSDAFMRSARIRANASDGPPAANGTMIVIGLVGYVCALATLRRPAGLQHRLQDGEIGDVGISWPWF